MLSVIVRRVQLGKSPLQLVDPANGRDIQGQVDFTGLTLERLYPPQNPWRAYSKPIAKPQPTNGTFTLDGVRISGNNVVRKARKAEVMEALCEQDMFVIDTIDLDGTPESWNCIAADMSKGTGNPALDRTLLLRGTESLNFTGPHCGPA